jgi:chromosome segregation ATPase
MALEMRRQLQELQTRQIPIHDPALEASNMRELQSKQEELRQNQEDFDDRLRQLDDEEKAVAQTRNALEADADALQKMRSRCERDLAKARQDADAEIRSLWKVFEQRRQQAEQEISRALSAVPAPPPPAVPAPVAVMVSTGSTERRRQLDHRSAELTSFARHLKRTRERLQDNAAVERDNVQLRAALAALETATAAAPVAQQVPDNRVELAGLERENERLRQENSDLRRKIEAPRQDPETRVQMVKLEGQMAGLRKQAELAAAAEQEQRNRLGSLEKEMRDRDNLIVQLQDRLNKGGVWDTATFNALEAELIFNRRELERDRQALADQASQLRERQLELKDAIRENEVQMSRERAQLARDRAELTRMRDEVRGQQERRQRTGTGRDPLAALRSQDADTVVDGKLEEAPKPSPSKPRLTSQRRRPGT